MPTTIIPSRDLQRHSATARPPEEQSTDALDHGAQSELSSMRFKGHISMTMTKLVALCGSEPQLPLAARLRVVVDGAVLQEMEIDIVYRRANEVHIRVPDMAVFLQHGCQRRKYQVVRVEPPLLLQVDLWPLPQKLQLSLRKTRFHDLFGGTPPALPVAVQLRVSVLGVLQQGMEQKARICPQGSDGVLLEVDRPPPALEALIKAHNRRSRTYSLVSAAPVPVLQVDLVPCRHSRTAGVPLPATDVSAAHEGVSSGRAIVAEPAAAAPHASRGSGQPVGVRPPSSSDGTSVAVHSAEGCLEQPREGKGVAAAATSQQQRQQQRQRQQQQQDSAGGLGEGSGRAGPSEVDDEEERGLQAQKKKQKRNRKGEASCVQGPVAEEKARLEAAEEEKRVRKKQRRLRKEAERAARAAREEGEGEARGRGSATALPSGAGARSCTAAASEPGWSAGTAEPVAGASPTYTWSRKDVGSWLRGMGAQELVEGFKKHRMDGWALEGLFLIGFDQMGTQVEIMCGPVAVGIKLKLLQRLTQLFKQ